MHEDNDIPIVLTLLITFSATACREEGQPEQGRHVRSVRQEGGRADRHHAGDRRQQDGQAMQGRRQGGDGRHLQQAADRCDHQRRHRQGRRVLRRFAGRRLRDRADRRRTRNRSEEHNV